MTRLVHARTNTTTPSRANSVLVIILNFNGIADTIACLDSLAVQTDPDVAVLVIDNGSRADDLTPIRENYPDVEVIALPQNLGWAGGNNVGMRLAMQRGFGAVCLLNNDTVMFPTALAELRAAAAFIGKPSMMHPSIAFFHEPERWQLHPERMWAAQDSTPDNHPEMGMVEMPFAYGACLWLSAEVLAKIGLFDERFFLQMEEADYFHRAKQFGIRSYCTARAQILHKESATFGGNVTPGKTYYQVRNSLLIVEKHARSWATFRHEISELFWALTRQAKQSRPQISGNVGLLRWLFSRDPLACAAREGFGDYAFRRFGQRTSTRVAEPRGG